MYEDNFCKRLTELRLQKEVSARDMSLSLGQSESYINRIENKQMLPSLTVFFYICDYFHMKPHEFFDDSPEHDIEIIEITNNLMKLDPKKREHVAQIIKDLSD